MSKYEARKDSGSDIYEWQVHEPRITAPPSEDYIGPNFTEAEANIIAWALNQIAEGRVIVALVDPTVAPEGPRYADYYCEDYTGPTEGVAP